MEVVDKLKLEDMTGEEGMNMMMAADADREMRQQGMMMNAKDREMKQDKDWQKAVEGGKKELRSVVVVGRKEEVGRNIKGVGELLYREHGLSLRLVSAMISTCMYTKLSIKSTISNSNYIYQLNTP